MNSRFKSTGGKEIEEKCPVRIYVISITYILTGQDIYWRFIDKKFPFGIKKPKFNRVYNNAGKNIHLCEIKKAFW